MDEGSKLLNLLFLYGKPGLTQKTSTVRELAVTIVQSQGLKPGGPSFETLTRVNTASVRLPRD